MDGVLKRRNWILFGIATLFWHLLLFTAPWDRWIPPHDGYLVPKKVNVRPLTSEQVEKVRERWRQKQLLISKDKTPPKDAPKPKDARYQSDRNRTVEKEEIAKFTQVMPQEQVGIFQPQEAAKPAEEAPQNRIDQRSLRSLGVPLNLAARDPKEAVPDTENRGPLTAPIPEGGDQALLEEGQDEKNILNTERSIYYSYYSRLYEAIGPIWQSRLNQVTAARQLAPGDYITQVDVMFDRFGNLVKIRYLSRSGVPVFDKIVEESWMKIRTFPNPPKDLIGEDGLVHTPWSFNVFINGEYIPDFRPPQRIK